MRMQKHVTLLGALFIAYHILGFIFGIVIMTLLPAIGLVVLLVGAMRVDAGAITAGDVVTALYLLSLLTFPIQLIELMVSVQKTSEDAGSRHFCHQGDVIPAGRNPSEAGLSQPGR